MISIGFLARGVLILPFVQFRILVYYSSLFSSYLLIPTFCKVEMIEREERLHARKQGISQIVFLARGVLIHPFVQFQILTYFPSLFFLLFPSSSLVSQGRNDRKRKRKSNSFVDCPRDVSIPRFRELLSRKILFRGAALPRPSTSYGVLQGRNVRGRDSQSFYRLLYYISC